MKVLVRNRVGKLITLGIIAMLALAVFALAGCSTQQDTSASQPETQSGSQSSAQSSQESAKPEAESPATPTTTQPSTTEKVLVAYFSAAGHTEKVANDIAADLNADTFVITPVQPYTAEDLNWNQQGSRVNNEHENENARNIPLTQVTPANFADYDVVFIGYPIWWGIAAWPVDGFVSGNDFGGKTVIPFCTSNSSGLGQSADLLQQISNGGTWLPGMRFSENASSQEVIQWVNSLNLNR